jgi:hypothetical protein
MGSTMAAVSYATCHHCTPTRIMPGPPMVAKISMGSR